jgi:hypothetical protein
MQDRFQALACRRGRQRRCGASRRGPARRPAPARPGRRIRHVWRALRRRPARSGHVRWRRCRPRSTPCAANRSATALLPLPMPPVSPTMKVTARSRRGWPRHRARSVSATVAARWRRRSPRVSTRGLDGRLLALVDVLADLIPFLFSPAAARARRLRPGSCPERFHGDRLPGRRALALRCRAVSIRPASCRPPPCSQDR